MNSKFMSIFRVLISVTLISLLLWFMRGEYGNVLMELKKTNLGLFFLALILFCGNIIFITWRLKALFNSESIRIPFIRLTELSYIGHFFNNFMPSAVGGDIVKAYYAGRSTRERAKSYASVFMDRFIGLFSFAFIAFLTMLFTWRNITDVIVKKSVITFVLLCGFGALALLNIKIAKFISEQLSKINFMKIGPRLSNFYNVIHNYRYKKEILLKTFFISLIGQMVYFITIHILFKSMKLEISFKDVLLIMPIVSVISMLPSIGGLGLREGAMVVLFGPFVGNEKAFGASVLLLAILFLISIIGGIIYLSSPQFRTIKIEEEA